MEVFIMKKNWKFEFVTFGLTDDQAITIFRGATKLAEQFGADVTGDFKSVDLNELELDEYTPPCAISKEDREKYYKDS